MGEPTQVEKYAHQIGFIFPKVWGELQRTLKPPPSCSLFFCDFHHKKLTGHLSPPVLGRQIIEIWRRIDFEEFGRKTFCSNEVGTWLPTVAWRCGLVGKPQDL